jgi:hypothetical protein
MPLGDAGWVNGPLDAVLFADGSVAVFTGADSILRLFDASGNQRWTWRWPVHSDQSRGSRLALFALGGDSLLVVEDASRRTAILSRANGLARRDSFSQTIAGDVPLHSRGVLEDGTIVAQVMVGMDADSAGTFRRIYDVIGVAPNGSTTVLHVGARSAHELGMLRVSGDTDRVQRMVSRFPAKARYFQTLALAGNTVFLLADAREVRSVRLGRSIVEARVTLGLEPSNLTVARIDTAFTAAEIVPLGLLGDSAGRLWVEQPRGVRNAQSRWWIVDAQAVRGEIILPDTCRLRAASLGEILCQIRDLRTGTLTPLLIVVRL